MAIYILTWIKIKKQKNTKFFFFFFFFISSSSSGPFHIPQLVPSLKTKNLKEEELQSTTMIDEPKQRVSNSHQCLSLSSASCCWWTISQSLNAWITHTHARKSFFFCFHPPPPSLLPRNKKTNDCVMLSVVLMVQLFSFCYFLDKLEIYIYLKLPFIWTKTSTSVKVQFLEKKKKWTD